MMRLLWAVLLTGMVLLGAAYGGSVSGRVSGGQSAAGGTTYTGTNPIVVTGSTISATCAGAGQSGPLCTSGAAGTQLTVDAGMSVIGKFDATTYGAISTANTLNITGAANISFQGGSADSSGIITCAANTGGNCYFRSNIGSAAATTTVAAFHFQHMNGALSATDLEFSFEDSSGTPILKGNEAGLVTAVSLKVSSTLTAGTITLASGTGTATVNASSICTATDTAASPLALRASISGTTLTVSEVTGTSTHVVNYICL